MLLCCVSAACCAPLSLLLLWQLAAGRRKAFPCAAHASFVAVSLLLWLLQMQASKAKGRVWHNGKHPR